jgi:hypothetical protein
MLLLIIHMVFFWKINVFHLLCTTGLFRLKSGYLHLEKPELQDIFLAKTDSIFPQKQCARGCSFSQVFFF